MAIIIKGQLLFKDLRYLKNAIFSNSVTHKLVLKCVVPENIHTLPMEGMFSSSLASYLTFTFVAFRDTSYLHRCFQCYVHSDFL